MMRQGQSSWFTLSGGVLASLLVLITLVGFTSPAVASSPSSVALRIAQYAVATASNDKPARVVTAADVSNAVGISSLNTKGLDPIINLDDVYGFSRLVLFFEQKPFADICLNFPNTVGGAPKIIPCPHKAQGLWEGQAGSLNVSNRAVADAAASGNAVSGADVVAAAKIYHLTLRNKPTFLAGQGGKVEFVTLVEMGLNTKFNVDNCVRLPKTAFGVPLPVPC
jgi:hypothetical protein